MELRRGKIGPGDRAKPCMFRDCGGDGAAPYALGSTRVALDDRHADRVDRALRAGAEVEVVHRFLADALVIEVYTARP